MAAGPAVAEHWKGLAPLTNASGEPGLDFEILPGVTIREATAGEQTGMNSLPRIPEMDQAFVPALRPVWVLATIRPITMLGQARNVLPIFQDFQLAAACLRAYRPEMVAFPYVAVGAPDFGVPSAVPGFNALFPPGTAWVRAISKPYVLAKDDVVPLVALAGRIRDELMRDPEGSLSIALSRLEFIQQRWLDQDRIIDAEIAMEALLGEGLDGELSYRQALRGSWLVGRGPEERALLFDEFKAAYGRRSKLVHGDKEKKQVPSADRIAELAHLVVRRFVETAAGRSVADVVEALDLAALRGK